MTVKGGSTKLVFGGPEAPPGAGGLRKEAGAEAVARGWFPLCRQPFGLVVEPLLRPPPTSATRPGHVGGGWGGRVSGGLIRQTGAFSTLGGAHTRSKPDPLIRTSFALSLERVSGALAEAGDIVSFAVSDGPGGHGDGEGGGGCAGEGLSTRPGTGGLRCRICCGGYNRFHQERIWHTHVNDGSLLRTASGTRLWGRIR